MSQDNGDAKAFIADLVARSRAAQKQIEHYSQEQVDALIRAMVWSVARPRHGPHHRSDQRIDLLLRIVLDLLLSGARSRNQIRDKCLGVTIILRHDGLSPNHQKTERLG